MLPAAYEGLWRRSGIWRSDGSSDLSTQVWWFQAARFHIDLRVPADGLGISGFAGVTVVDGERCEWRPAIAYPALSAELDAGWMRFDDADHLHETGLDNSYDEDWYREPTGAMHGIRLQDPHSDAVAYLLISEHWMAWAAGRPGEPCAIAVYRGGQHWQAVASTHPGRTPAAVTLPLEHALQWQPGALVDIPMTPGRAWRA